VARLGRVRCGSAGCGTLGQCQLAFHGFRKRHQSGEGPEHDVQLVNQALAVDVDEVAAFDRAITNTSPEHKRVISRIGAPNLTHLVEVLEHLTHRAEQGLDLRTALLGRMDHRAAEHDVVRKQGHQPVQVAALNRIAELLHLDLLSVSLQARCLPPASGRGA
jgi:hypothetical protein